MNPFLIVALEWLRSNWRNVGLGAGLLFMVLFLRQCGEIAACRGDLASSKANFSVIEAQKQSLEGKLASTARATGKIVYVTVPGKPCPEVHVDFTAEGGGTAEGRGTQSQDATVTAKAGPQAGEQPLWGVTVGGGREILAGEALDAKVGVNYGCLGVEAGVNTEGKARVGGFWTYWFK